MCSRIVPVSGVGFLVSALSFRVCFRWFRAWGLGLSGFEDSGFRVRDPVNQKPS